MPLNTARRAWTARRSRISRRTARSDGSGNWRLRSRKRRIGQTRSAGFGSPSPTASSGRLGIPTIRDRVVQTAALLVLEPIFEADLPPEQYAYRQGRMPAGGEDVRMRCSQGQPEVVDADLSGLLRQHSARGTDAVLARRLVDKPCCICSRCGWMRRSKRPTSGAAGGPPAQWDSGRGTPQGSPISPLLANLYMRRSCSAGSGSAWAPSWRKIVNLRGRLRDPVRRGMAEEALAAMRAIMGKLKLTVNEAEDADLSVAGGARSTSWATRLGGSYSPRRGEAHASGCQRRKGRFGASGRRFSH